MKTSYSYIWKGLRWAQELIFKGSYWELGDGQNINIWKDPWILGLPNQTLPILIEI